MAAGRLSAAEWYIAFVSQCLSFPMTPCHKCPILEIEFVTWLDGKQMDSLLELLIILLSFEIWPFVRLKRLSYLSFTSVSSIG